MRALLPSLLLFALFLGCDGGGSSSTASGGGGDGGAATTGGTAGTGGSVMTGGTAGTGGSVMTGGTAGTGGAVTTGGGGMSTGGTGGSTMTTPCVAGTVEPCYEGPPGTEGVGLCAPGTMTCLANGSNFGPCEGQVLPAEETCASAIDEDCNGIDCAVWVTSAPGYWFVQAVEKDAAGHVYVAATLNAQATFGGQTFNAGGGADAFLVELDQNGQFVQAHKFGGPGGEYATSLDVAPDGTAVMAGYFNGAVDFGGVVLNGMLSGFIVVLEPNGATRWAIALPLEVANNAVAFAPNGDVVLAGATIGPIDLGGGVLTPNEVDMLVARFAQADGSHVWSKIHGGAGNQVAWGLAASPLGGYAAVGVNAGSLNVGTMTLQKGAGYYSAFVARMDEMGALTAGATITEVGSAQSVVLVKDVQVDDSGAVYVAGKHDEGIDIDGPGPLPPHFPTLNANHVFFAKYDPQIQLSWHRFLGWSSQLRPSIAVSGSRVYFASDFAVPIDFGGGSIPIDDDVALAAYDTAGALQWVRVFPAAGGTPELFIGPGPVAGTVFGAASMGGADSLDLGGMMVSGATPVVRFGP